jgi:hypothetical protein
MSTPSPATTTTILNSAHGDDGWRPRIGSLADEAGSIWGAFGVSSEVGQLRAVLMHWPGDEISAVTDPSAVLWDAPIEQELTTFQHDTLAETYRKLGVEVHYMAPGDRATPNLYFARDHFFYDAAGRDHVAHGLSRARGRGSLFGRKALVAQRADSDERAWDRNV